MPVNRCSCFVFVKPIALTDAGVALIRDTLQSNGIRVLKEGQVSGQAIKEKGLINNHYYSQYAKACLHDAKAITSLVNKTSFEETFDMSWDQVSLSRILISFLPLISSLLAETRPLVKAVF